MSEQKRLPFEPRLLEDTVTRTDGIRAFREIRKQLVGEPELSMEEINAEINEIRAERKITQSETLSLPRQK